MDTFYWVWLRMDEIVELLVNTSDVPFDPDDPLIYDLYFDMHISKRLRDKITKELF